ncbi:MAG: CDP-diacylglycerol--glycerol-3-phosphate 3-phosphatidyltransferase [Planctomycetota bacterium]
MSDPTTPSGSGAVSEEARRRPGASEPAAGVWNLPNQLTIARIALSVVFFILLAVGRGAIVWTGVAGLRIDPLLDAALVVFALAVLTDSLDGYLARKYKLVSSFGRIADPFADKMLVCGGFVMLIGVAPQLVPPWYAVVILFREFLVSGLRSFLESRGVAFGAAWSGKFKMVLQSVAIPFVLFYQANLAAAEPGGSWAQAAEVFRALTIALLAATLAVTVGSSVGYVRRAVSLIRAESGAS